MSSVKRFGLVVRHWAGRQKDLGSIPLQLSFSLQKGCGLWTLSCDFVPHSYWVSETLKWLSSLPTLMEESFQRWQCSDKYIISFFPPPPYPLAQHVPKVYIISCPHLHAPFPHFALSLISLVVSVDVKHHVYFGCLLGAHCWLLCVCLWEGWGGGLLIANK